MTNVSLSGIGIFVHALVPDVPSAISGTRMLEIIDRKREFVQQYTGTTIGSNAIEDKFQDPITLLSAAQVAKSMMLTGVDAGNVRLGDFSISKGTGDNITTAANVFEQDGMQQLRLLGRKVSNYQAYYG